jgi:hypothetical protein
MECTVGEAARNEIASPPEAGAGETDGPPAARWGVWESAATALVFCLPAVLALNRRGDAPDAVGWALVMSAAAGALVLTVAARGLKDTQVFLMVAVVTCAVWFFGGGALGYGDGLAPHAVLIPLLLVAHYHTVPVTLFRSLRRAGGRIAAEGLRGVRRMAWGVVVSVAALDLGLLLALVASLVAPGKLWLSLALMWMMAAVAAGGVFATLAAWKLPGAPGCARAATPGRATGGDAAAGPGEGAPERTETARPEPQDGSRGT